MDDSSVPPAVERSQAVLDSMPVFVSVHAADGSNTCTDVYYHDDLSVALADADLTGTTLDTVVGADAAARIGRSVEETVETATVQYTEFRAQTGGESTWYGAYLAPLDEGSEAGADEAVLVAFDVTRLKEAASILHDAIDAIVRQTPQHDLERAFCGRLVDQWPYEMAWIGELDPDGGVSVRGEQHATRYLSDLNGVFESLQSAPDPGVRALKAGEPIRVDAADGTGDGGDWPTIARQYDVEAAVALPLSHAGTNYGVLAAYTSDASTLVPWRRALLEEYADVVSYAIAAETWREALTTDATARVDLEVRGGSPLVELCADAGTTSLSIAGVTPRKAETVYHLGAVDGDRRALREAVVDHPSMQPLTGEETDVEGVVLETPAPENDLARRGLRFETYDVLPDGMQVGISVPTSDLVGYATSRMRAGYDGVCVSIEWDTDPPSSVSSNSSLAGILTSTQHETLETAYQLGYFKRDPDVNLTDIADALDKSRWTVSEHLRLAHQALIEHHR